MRGPTLQQVRTCAGVFRRREGCVGVDVLEEDTADGRHTLEATFEGQRVPPGLCKVLYDHDLGVYRCAPQGPDHVTLLAR